ncbi:MAG: methyltransferase [Acidobacteria bacterium]|nr:MAG: methyltransferase [Acidobacteriota bacterium]
MYRTVQRCRICGNPNLISLLSLGEQALTGIFPSEPETPLARGPLELVRCTGSGDSDHCGLVQLGHSYDSAELYGDNYGYRSSLNRSMVEHLRGKVAKLVALASLRDGDTVLDIGSNDGTTLSFFPEGKVLPVGIDPTARKWRRFYRRDALVVPDLFSAARVRSVIGEKRLRIITSLAMFYDLEDPQSFVNQVTELLADDGIWHLEQSYVSAMLSVNAYDTICHEHVEYYALRQVNMLAERAGLKLIDVELNEVNGGSFAVTAAKKSSPYRVSAAVAQVQKAEDDFGLNEPATYARFGNSVWEHRRELKALLAELRAAGKKVIGYGASTKGNVILQFCNFGPEDLECIAEVNEEKFGKFTPGTGIPIVSELEAKARKPDYLLVFPWHFRKNLVEREAAFLAGGGRMIFPLPKIEVIGAEAVRGPTGSKENAPQLI